MSAAATLCPRRTYSSPMLTENTLSDEQEHALLRKARWGDQEAFARLYRAHATAVHTLALRLTGNRATAEDVTQDTFLRMTQFLNGLRDDVPLRPWLKRVAANHAIDLLRKDRKLVPEADFETLEGADSHAQEHATEFDGLLRRLAPLARTLVWLHEMEGWSHPELAARFDRTPSWSKSIVSRAIARLKHELDGGQAT